MVNNNADMQEMTEILRLSGQGIAVMFKGLGKTLKGLKKVGKAGYMKALKLHIALRYHKEASESNYGLLSLKTLQKITGEGEYQIFNIPTEDPKELADFVNNMKKSGIRNAAMMPDLNLGDGFTQIAIDPQYATPMNNLVKLYNDDRVKNGEETMAHEMDFGDYYNSANKEQVDKFIDEAVENIKAQQKNGEFDDMPIASPEEQGKVNKTKVDKDNIVDFVKAKMNSYYNVSVPKTCLIAESEKAYTVKIPGSYDAQNNSYQMMNVSKKNVEIKEGVANLKINKEGETSTFQSNDKTPKKKANKELFDKYFSPEKKTDKSKNTSKSIKKDTSKKSVKK